ncbi:hypothetical protein FSP39_023087 [Pinctada imbricata]|uniref:Spermatogenesis-associated protein 1 C-terminal domain-containing protein n=1 Tax=Pinctada imbricata TaxID=66713 RepID=A0AA89C2E6_PINIB|nr:hypothetical protein FSP39_023087 [Pinctada imbricata]
MNGTTSVDRMQSSFRGSSFRNYRQKRPQSAELVDLHVYIVPPDIWREQYNNLLNQNVTETVSAGIIRVHPEVKVYSLREEIDQQIGAELLPQDYVFLKSVGRSITRLKPKQEYQLKAKHFIPPQAYAPEIFLLEVGPGDSRGSTGPHSPSIGQPYNSQSYHHPESEDGSQTGKNRHLRSTTSPYRYSPLPKIKQTRTSSKESHRHDYGSHNGDTRGSREGVRGSQSRVSSRARSPPQTDRPQQINKPHQSDRTPHTDRPSYSDKPPSQPRSRPNSQPRDRPTSDNRRSDSRNRPPSDNRSRQRSRERSRASSRHQSPARQGSPTTGHNSASPTPSSDRERDHDHHRDRRHQDRSPHKQEKYDGTYTNHTNEDSGINVITPEEHYEALDRRKPEEHRQPEVHARLQPTHDDDDDERQRRSQEDREREEWERRRREEEERRRIEEEEKRRREQEDQQREDDEQRRREEERDRMTKDQKLTGSDEDLNRFPSPPPMQVHDVHSERETESAKRRRKEEKERLLRELEAAREARRVVERQREELVKKAKAMQSKTQNRRNHADVDGEEDSEKPSDDDEARDVWKKRYFEEKKRTPPLEEQCNRLRTELDIIHRKLMNTLEGPSKDKSTRGDMKPSQKNNYKIQATRLTHEIDDMRRRLENAKMKLTAEMKLRNQAETELRALRAELTQKKIHLTLTRNQQLAALTPGSSSQDLYMMPALTPKS